MDPLKPFSLLALPPPPRRPDQVIRWAEDITRAIADEIRRLREFTVQSFAGGGGGGGGDEVLISGSDVTDPLGVNLLGGFGITATFNGGGSPDTGTFAIDTAVVPTWTGKHTFSGLQNANLVELIGTTSGRSPRFRLTPDGVASVDIFAGSDGAFAVASSGGVTTLISATNAIAGLRHLTIPDGQVIIGDNTDVNRQLFFNRLDADGIITWDGADFDFNDGVKVGGDLEFTVAGPNLTWPSAGLQLGNTSPTDTRNRIGLGRAFDSRFMFTLQGRMEDTGACLNFLIENINANETVTGIVAQSRGRGVAGFGHGAIYRGLLLQHELRNPGTISGGPGSDPGTNVISAIIGSVDRVKVSAVADENTDVTTRYGSWFEANPDPADPGFESGTIATTYAHYIEDIAFGTDRFAIYSVADDFRCGGKMLHAQINGSEAHANYADLAGTPSPLVVGDLWRDGGAFNYRKDGSTTVDLTLGGGGGGDSFLEWAAL